MAKRAKGTMEVKNAKGQNVPFHPTTDISCVASSEGVALAQTISNLEAQITEAENSGGIELMTEEPTSANTSSFANDTLIGWLMPEEWKFTVDTSYISQYNEEQYRRVTGLPINLYYQFGYDGSLNVDWGDGSSSILQESDFSSTNDSAGIHQYAENGIYAVNISAKTPDWESLFLNSTFMGLSPLGEITSNHQTAKRLQFFKATLVSIDSKLPKVNGTYGNTKIEVGSNNTTYYYSERLYRSLAGLFFQCIHLRSIPEDLFADNDHVVNLNRCLLGCSELNDFVIHIASPDVETAESFVTPKDGASRTVYVPQGSTTQNTFNAISNSLGLTIIGE